MGVDDVQASSSSLFERTPSKTSLSLPTIHPLEVEQPPLPRHTRSTAIQKRVQTSFPSLYARLSTVFLYVRGPRPRVPLPDQLNPLLDIDITVRESHLKLPIETSWSRYTRPLAKEWIMLILGAAYIVSLAFFSRVQSYLTPAESFIGCTSTYWISGNGCGVDGVSCGPFNDSSFDFRCPAQCAGTILQNPHTVGNEQVAFVPLIVGGGDDNQTYRGDTFICAAAIQAGLISNSRGGCASLELVGNFTNFLPTTAHGLSSIGFPSVFPLSFRFRENTSLKHCEDKRNAALAFNIVVLCFVFAVLRPRPIILFWTMLCIGYWHITLFSEPKSAPPNLSGAFADFLPTLFVGYGFWRIAFRFVLPAFSKAPIERTIWYLGPFWVGVLTNLTFGEIPIDRLTAQDLQKRPGAITALIIIVVILALLILNQARVVRKTGWLPYYLGWYAAGGLVVLVLALLPGLQLRLHHYIIALLLIPVTAFPTRLSAIYQGLLLGLFLNGVAAFGFDSILQTPAELLRDAVMGSDLPSFITNSTNYNASVPFANQVISWNSLPTGWDGFSLLVDDVERIFGPATSYSLAALNATIPHFFRLALISGGLTADYTMSATLYPNGTWVDPLPGASRS